MKLLKILTAFATLVALQIAAAQWLNVPPPVEARGLMMVGGGVPVVAGCTTPNTGSELDEGFIGAGYEVAGWSEVGDGTVNENYTLDGSPPAGSCTEGLNVIAADSNTYAQWDRGSGIDITGGANVIDLTFSVYVKSASMASYSYLQLLVLSPATNPSTTPVLALKLRCNSGSACTNSNLQFSFNSETGSRVSMSVNTWYEIKMHIDLSGTSYFQVVGAGSTTCDTEGECAVTTTDDQDGRYLSVGVVVDTGSGEGADVVFGEIHINIP